MILALVVTTTMAPVASHAMPNDSAKAAQTEAPTDHDCHGHGSSKADQNKAAQSDKDGSDKCCDKGICKCVGGTCHNGLSKVLGNAGSSQLALNSSKAQIAFADENADSAFLEGLKRPPRT